MRRRIPGAPARRRAGCCRRTGREALPGAASLWAPAAHKRVGGNLTAQETQGFLPGYRHPAAVGPPRLLPFPCPRDHSGRHGGGCRDGCQDGSGTAAPPFRQVGEHCISSFRNSSSKRIAIPRAAAAVLRGDRAGVVLAAAARGAGRGHRNSRPLLPTPGAQLGTLLVAIPFAGNSGLNSRFETAISRDLHGLSHLSSSHSCEFIYIINIDLCICINTYKIHVCT